MARNLVANGVPPEVHFAGLRSRLVSRLTGLSVPRIRYWHESQLLEASLRAGAPGIPRLYSWVDYMRLRIAASLAHDDVPARRIRRAVEFLDGRVPNWYLISLESDRRKHVLARRDSTEARMLADEGGQYLLQLDAVNDFEESGEPLRRALTEMRRRGPLGALEQFGDAVSMSPMTNLAQPTLRGTALETRFVAGMAQDLGPELTAEMYRLPLGHVRRAIAFEEAVA